MALIDNYRIHEGFLGRNNDDGMSESEFTKLLLKHGEAVLANVGGVDEAPSARDGLAAPTPPAEPQPKRKHSKSIDLEANQPTLIKTVIDELVPQRRYRRQ